MSIKHSNFIKVDTPFQRVPLFREVDRMLHKLFPFVKVVE